MNEVYPHDSSIEFYRVKKPFHSLLKDDSKEEPKL